MKSHQIGMSINNDFSKGYVDGDTALRFFELEISCTLVITNSSPHTAYYPKLIFDPAYIGLELLEKFDELKPMISGEVREIKSRYIVIEEKIGRERTPHNEAPKYLDKIRILLEYKNSLKTGAYTLYEQSAKSNTFLYKKPASFKTIEE